MKLLILPFLLLSSTLIGAGQSPLPGNSPNTTVFIGDSITAFGNAQGTAPDQSYGWGWSAQAVFLSNGRIEQLYNAGSPGQTSAQIASRFPTDVVAFNPGTVVIMAGTNDATTSSLSANALAAVVKNLQSMISQAKQAGIQPICVPFPREAMLPITTATSSRSMGRSTNWRRRNEFYWLISSRSW